MSDEGFRWPQFCRDCRQSGADRAVIKRTLGLMLPCDQFLLMLPSVRKVAATLELRFVELPEQLTICFGVVGFLGTLPSSPDALRCASRLTVPIITSPSSLATVLRDFADRVLALRIDRVRQESLEEHRRMSRGGEKSHFNDRDKPPRGRQKRVLVEIHCSVCGRMFMRESHLARHQAQSGQVSYCSRACWAARSAKRLLLRPI